jgi:hypothetical protein
MELYVLHGMLLAKQLVVESHLIHPCVNAQSLPLG